MHIAVSSQNFREVTGHAGRARRFLVYAVVDGGVAEVGRLDLPKELAMHGFDHHARHPLHEMDVLITGGAGEGFRQRLAEQGVRVVATTETNPETAVRAFLAGSLAEPPSDCSHDHQDGDQGSHEGCSCHG